MTKKSKKKAVEPDWNKKNHYTVTIPGAPFTVPVISRKTEKKMHPRQRALRGRWRLKRIHGRVKRALKNQKKGDRR